MGELCLAEAAPQRCLCGDQLFGNNVSVSLKSGCRLLSVLWPPQARTQEENPPCPELTEDRKIRKNCFLTDAFAMGYMPPFSNGKNPLMEKETLFSHDILIFPCKFNIFPIIFGRENNRRDYFLTDLHNMLLAGATGVIGTNRRVTISDITALFHML